MSTYTITADTGVVEVTLAGSLGYDTIAAMLEELDGLAKAAFPNLLNVLVDETDVRAGLLRSAQIRTWIGRWAQAAALKEGRIAVIATNPVMYGLNRMAHGVAGAESEGHLAVFRDRAAALDWLLAPGSPVR